MKIEIDDKFCAEVRKGVIAAAWIFLGMFAVLVIYFIVTEGLT